MDIAIDHVTVAGRSLDDLESAFAGVGIEPSYGGAHSNGVTHMSTVPFPDGTYLECISTLEPGTTSPWWDAAIRTDAGPCAWAIRVPDAAAAAETFADRGVAVEGPNRFARERPDGTRLEWDLVYLGDGEPGSVLPFCIADRTPRERRVGEPLTDTGLRGADTVVLGVGALDAAADRLRAAFDLPAPTRTTSDFLNATVARFPEAPVAVATPDGNGWLADRLDAIGDAPCGYLFDAAPAAVGRYPVAETEPWGDGGAAWLAPDAVGGLRALGLRAR
jgi:hypothetical protein